MLHFPGYKFVNLIFVSLLIDNKNNINNNEHVNEAVQFSNHIILCDAYRFVIDFCVLAASETRVPTRKDTPN